VTIDTFACPTSLNTIMTCIAWDGRLLVADGQITFGDQIADLDAAKLHRLSHPTHGPMIAGLSGSCALWAKWLNEIEGSGFSASVAEIDTAEGLFVDREGRCWEVQTAGTWERVKRYAATGSGATFAYTVLRDGGSAVDAVRCASRHSTTCGGTIRIYDPASNVVVALR
jgi:hypothetical protein